MNDYIQAIYDTPLPETSKGYRQNIESVTLYVYDHQLIIEPNFIQTRIQSTLRIDRNTQAISSVKNEQKELTTKMRKYSAFLGILPVLHRVFLVFIEDVKMACTIQGHDVFEVASLAYVDLSNSTEKDEKLPKIEQYLFYLRECIFKQGFYFSYSYDLSICKMRYAQGYSSQLKFCWNSFISKQLRNVDASWMISLIQGSINTFNVFIEGEKLQYFLINRRSWRRGGTRYNSRGLDDRGNVANFVETEQLIYYKGFICSHVQIRGSVPAFWRQSGITAKVQFTREHQSTKIAFGKHFSKLSSNYNSIFCINLLGKNKIDEYQLTLYYEELIKKAMFDYVRYEYFDFHFACKGQKFERANYLINKIAEVNIGFNFYAEDIARKEVVRTQKGVFRTNCIDCLDRTNYVQTKVAIHILQYILKTLSISIQKVFGCESLVSALDQKNKTSSMLIVNFKNAWADAGDMISNHYTGTGSTHTNVTRTGKRNLVGIVDHGMKTLGRFYQQNVQDNYKQEVIDLFVGEHTQTINLSEFQARLKEIKHSQNIDQLEIIGI